MPLEAFQEGCWGVAGCAEGIEGHMTTRTTRRMLRDGTVHVRTVEVRPVAPRECAWCRSTDRVQAVGISDYLGRPGWVVMTCPGCLGKTFEEGRKGRA